MAITLVPVAQEVEAEDRRNDGQRQHIEDRKATGNDPGGGRQQHTQQVRGLTTDKVTQLVVDDVSAEIVLQVGQLFAGPALQRESHIAGSAWPAV